MSAGEEKSPDRLDALVWAITELILQIPEENLFIIYEEDY